MANQDAETIQSDAETFIWIPSLLDTVMYAAAMWEFQRLHFDAEWAPKEGLDKPIVQGPLLGTKLTQLVEKWARERGGKLIQIRWRCVRVVEIGTEVELRLHVETVTESDERSQATLELSMSSSRGEHVRGSAIVALGESS